MSLVCKTCSRNQRYPRLETLTRNYRGEDKDNEGDDDDDGRSNPYADVSH